MSQGRSRHGSSLRRTPPPTGSASARPRPTGRPASPAGRALAVALLALSASALPIAPALAASCCEGAERDWRAGRILERSRGALVVRWAGDAAPDTIAIATAPLRDAVRTMRQPDRALLATSDADGVRTLAALGVRVNRWQRLAVLLGALAVLLLLAALLTAGRVRRLALGQDNRYSGSKCQMLAWFSVLVTSYLATVVLRGWAGGAQFAGGVSIPERLLLLSGLSALSFVAAKAITQGKVDRAETLAREQPAVTAAMSLKSPASHSSFPGDLVTDDRGRTDFGDFQMIVVTLLAVAVYVVRVFVCLGEVALDCRSSLPDVDTTLLGAFGIGQGAYLAKKAASRLGEG